MKQRIYSVFKKFVALAMILCFFVNTCFADVSGMSLNFSVKTETPKLIELDIPAELASVDEFWEAPAHPNPKMVVHIQNAHTNYEAQTKIRDLMAYLNKNYGFKTIFVEGASEELNPDYLKLFPDAATNKKLWDELAKRGQITGADWFLLQGGDGAKGVGIEKADLYRKNYEALKAVYSRDTETKRFLNGLDGELDKLATKILPPETRTTISEWKKFEKGHREFIPFVESLAKLAKENLKLDLKAMLSQVEWPQMTRILVLQEMEAKLKARATSHDQRTTTEQDVARGSWSVERAAMAERLEMIEWMKNNHMSKDLIDGLQRFDEKNINMNRIRASSGKAESLPRFFIEKLVAEAGPKGLKFSQYPNFALYTGYLILKYEVEPNALFEEIRKLFDQLLEASHGPRATGHEKEPSYETQTPESKDVARGTVDVEREKELIALFRDAELTRKLFNLELSRAEWGTVLARKAEVEPSKLFARVKDLRFTSHGPRATEKNPATSHELRTTEDKGVARGSWSTEKSSSKTIYQEEILKAFDSAFSFYDLAIQRDEVFYEKISRELEHTDRAILMTGGFHTEGMKEIFREKEISYGTLTPRLEKVEDSNLYREVMLGRSSARSTFNGPRATQAEAPRGLRNASPEGAQLGSIDHSDVEIISKLQTPAARLEQGELNDFVNELAEALSAISTDKTTIKKILKELNRRWADGSEAKLLGSGKVHIQTKDKNVTSDKSVASQRSEARGKPEINIFEIRNGPNGVKKITIDFAKGRKNLLRDFQDLGYPTEYLHQLAANFDLKFRFVQQDESYLRYTKAQPFTSEYFHDAMLEWKQYPDNKSVLPVVEVEISSRGHTEKTVDAVAAYIQALYALLEVEQFDDGVIISPIETYNDELKVARAVLKAALKAEKSESVLRSSDSGLFKNASEMDTSNDVTNEQLVENLLSNRIYVPIQQRSFARDEIARNGAGRWGVLWKSRMLLFERIQSSSRPDELRLEIMKIARDLDQKYNRDPLFGYEKAAREIVDSGWREWHRQMSLKELALIAKHKALFNKTGYSTFSRFARAFPIPQQWREDEVREGGGSRVYAGGFEAILVFKVPEFYYTEATNGGYSMPFLGYLMPPENYSAETGNYWFSNPGNQTSIGAMDAKFIDIQASRELNKLAARNKRVKTADLPQINAFLDELDVYQRAHRSEARDEDEEARWQKQDAELGQLVESAKALSLHPDQIQRDAVKAQLKELITANIPNEIKEGNVYDRASFARDILARLLADEMIATESTPESPRIIRDALIEISQELDWHDKQDQQMAIILMRLGVWALKDRVIEKFFRDFEDSHLKYSSRASYFAKNSLDGMYSDFSAPSWEEIAAHIPRIPLAVRSEARQESDDDNLKAGRQLLAQLRDPFFRSIPAVSYYWASEEIKGYIPDEDREMIRKTIDSYIPRKGTVLDFMSGKQLSFSKEERNVSGVSLVKRELDAHQRAGLLNVGIEQDVNKNTNLPFANGTFDSVVVSLGIMYLMNPIESLKELRRVLKPDGNLIIIYADNAWDASSAIRLWNQPSHFKEQDGHVIYRGIGDASRGSVFHNREEIVSYYLTQSGFSISQKVQKDGVQHEYSIRGVKRFDRVKQTNDYRIFVAQPNRSEARDTNGNISPVALNKPVQTYHQLVADIKTYFQEQGLKAGQKLDYVGPGATTLNVNNVDERDPWLVAALELGLHLNIFELGGRNGNDWEKLTGELKAEGHKIDFHKDRYELTPDESADAILMLSVLSDANGDRDLTKRSHILRHALQKLKNGGKLVLGGYNDSNYRESEVKFTDQILNQPEFISRFETLQRPSRDIKQHAVRTFDVLPARSESRTEEEETLEKFKTGESEWFRLDVPVSGGALRVEALAYSGVLTIYAVPRVKGWEQNKVVKISLKDTDLREQMLAIYSRLKEMASETTDLENLSAQVDQSLEQRTAPTHIDEQVALMHILRILEDRPDSHARILLLDRLARTNRAELEAILKQWKEKGVGEIAQLTSIWFSNDQITSKLEQILNSQRRSEMRSAKAVNAYQETLRALRSKKEAFDRLGVGYAREARRVQRVITRFEKLIDFMAVSDEAFELIDHFKDTPGIDRVLSRAIGGAKMNVTSGTVNSAMNELYQARELQNQGYKILAFSFEIIDPELLHKGQNATFMEADIVVEKDGKISLVEVKNIVPVTGHSKVDAKLVLSWGKDLVLKRGKAFTGIERGFNAFEQDSATRAFALQYLEGLPQSSDLKQKITDFIESRSKENPVEIVIVVNDPDQRSVARYLLSETKLSEMHPAIVQVIMNAEKVVNGIMSILRRFGLSWLADALMDLLEHQRPGNVILRMRQIVENGTKKFNANASSLTVASELRVATVKDFYVRASKVKSDYSRVKLITDLGEAESVLREAKTVKLSELIFRKGFAYRGIAGGRAISQILGSKYLEPTYPKNDSGWRTSDFENVMESATDGNRSGVFGLVLEVNGGVDQTGVENTLFAIDSVQLKDVSRAFLVRRANQRYEAIQVLLPSMHRSEMRNVRQLSGSKVSKSISVPDRHGYIDPLVLVGMGLSAAGIFVTAFASTIISVLLFVGTLTAVLIGFNYFKKYIQRIRDSQPVSIVQTEHEPRSHPYHLATDWVVFGILTLLAGAFVMDLVGAQLIKDYFGFQFSESYISKPLYVGPYWFVSLFPEWIGFRYAKKLVDLHAPDRVQLGRWGILIVDKRGNVMTPIFNNQKEYGVLQLIENSDQRIVYRVRWLTYLGVVFLQHLTQKPENKSKAGENKKKEFDPYAPPSSFLSLKQDVARSEMREISLIAERAIKETNDVITINGPVSENYILKSTDYGYSVQREGAAAPDEYLNGINLRTPDLFFFLMNQERFPYRDSPILEIGAYLEAPLQGKKIYSGFLGSIKDEVENQKAILMLRIGNFPMLKSLADAILKVNQGAETEEIRQLVTRIENDRVGYESIRNSPWFGRGMPFRDGRAPPQELLPWLDIRNQLKAQVIGYLESHADTNPELQNAIRSNVLIQPLLKSFGFQSAINLTVTESLTSSGELKKEVTVFFAPEVAAKRSEARTAVKVQPEKQLISISIPKWKWLRKFLADVFNKKNKGLGEAYDLAPGSLESALEKSIMGSAQVPMPQLRFQFFRDSFGFDFKITGWEQSWQSIWQQRAAKASTLSDRFHFLSMVILFSRQVDPEFEPIQKQIHDIYIAARTEEYDKEGLYGVKVKSVSIDFKEANGKIPGYLFLPEKKSNEKVPLVVMYHGFTQQKETTYFDLLEKDLLKKGIAVLRVDLLRHGENGTKFDRKYYMERFNNAIFQYINEGIDSELIDKDRIGVYGFSFGGNLALRAFGHHHQNPQLKAVAVLNPPLVSTFRDPRLMIRRFGSYLTHLFGTEDLSEVLKRSEGLRLALEKLEQNTKLHQHWSKDLPAIKAFSSQADEVISLSDRKQLKAIMAGINGELSLIPGASHSPVGIDRERVYADAANFFADKLLSARSEMRTPWNVFKGTSAFDQDLQAFIEKFLSKRYAMWGLSPDVASGMVQGLRTGQSEKEIIAGIRAVKQSAETWKAGYADYKEKTKYTTTLNQIAAELKGLRKDTVYLDVGAGNMELAGLVKSAHPTWTVTGTDPYTDAQSDQWTFLKQPSAVSLPAEIKPGSVDVITLNAALHHVDAEDRPILLQNLFNALKPGGKIILIEDSYSTELTLNPEADTELSGEFKEKTLWHKDEFAKQFFNFIDWYTNIAIHEWDGMNMAYEFHSIEDWQQILRVSGFEKTSGRWDGFPAKSFHKPSLGIITAIKPEISGSRVLTDSQTSIQVGDTLEIPNGYSGFDFMKGQVWTVDTIGHQTYKLHWEAGELPESKTVLVRRTALNYLFLRARSEARVANIHEVITAIRRKLVDHHPMALQDFEKINGNSRAVYDDGLFPLILEFIDTPQIDDILNKIANLSETAILGYVGELHHASELQKRGYQVLAMGIPFVDEKGQSMFEADYILKKDGKYYFGESKYYPGRRDYKNPDKYADPIEWTNRFILETTNGQSRKYAKLEKLITLLRTDTENKSLAAKKILKTLPQDDANAFLSQIRDSKQSLPVIFALSATIGNSLSADGQVVIRRNGKRDILLSHWVNSGYSDYRDMDQMQEHILKSTPSGFKTSVEYIPYRSFVRTQNISRFYSWPTVARRVVYIPDVKRVLDETLTNRLLAGIPEVWKLDKAQRHEKVEILRHRLQLLAGRKVTFDSLKSLIREIVPAEKEISKTDALIKNLTSAFYYRSEARSKSLNDYVALGSLVAASAVFIVSVVQFWTKKAPDSPVVKEVAEQKAVLPAPAKTEKRDEPMPAKAEVVTPKAKEPEPKPAASEVKELTVTQPKVRFADEDVKPWTPDVLKQDPDLHKKILDFFNWNFRQRFAFEYYYQSKDWKLTLDQLVFSAGQIDSGLKDAMVVLKESLIAPDKTPNSSVTALGRVNEMLAPYGMYIRSSRYGNMIDQKGDSFEVYEITGTKKVIVALVVNGEKKEVVRYVRVLRPINEDQLQLNILGDHMLKARVENIYAKAAEDEVQGILDFVSGKKTLSEQFGFEKDPSAKKSILFANLKKWAERVRNLKRFLADDEAAFLADYLSALARLQPLNDALRTNHPDVNFVVPMNEAEAAALSKQRAEDTDLNEGERAALNQIGESEDFKKVVAGAKRFVEIHVSAAGKLNDAFKDLAVRPYEQMIIEMFGEEGLRILKKSAAGQLSGDEQKVYDQVRAGVTNVYVNTIAVHEAMHALNGRFQIEGGGKVDYFRDETLARIVELRYGGQLARADAMFYWLKGQLVRGRMETLSSVDMFYRDLFETGIPSLAKKSMTNTPEDDIKTSFLQMQIRMPEIEEAFLKRSLEDAGLPTNIDARFMVEDIAAKPLPVKAPASISPTPQNTKPAVPKKIGTAKKAEQKSAPKTNLPKDKRRARSEMREAEFEELKDRLGLALNILQHGGPLDFAKQIQTVRLSLYAISRGYSKLGDFGKAEAATKISNEIMYRWYQYASARYESSDKFLAEAGYVADVKDSLLYKLNQIESSTYSAESVLNAQELKTSTLDYFYDFRKTIYDSLALIQAARAHGIMDTSKIKDSELDEVARLAMNLSALEDFLSEDEVLKVRKFEISKWLAEGIDKDRFLTKADEVIIANSAKKLKPVLTRQEVANIRTNPELLHILIERIISNGFHAINRLSDKAGIGPESLTVRLEKLKSKNKIRVVLTNPGRIPDEQLEIDPRTNLPRIISYQRIRQHQNHGIGMAFSQKALETLFPGEQIHFANRRESIIGKPIVEISFEIPYVDDLTALPENPPAVTAALSPASARSEMRIKISGEQLSRLHWGEVGSEELNQKINEAQVQGQVSQLTSHENVFVVNTPDNPALIFINKSDLSSWSSKIGKEIAPIGYASFYSRDEGGQTKVYLSKAFVDYIQLTGEEELLDRLIRRLKSKAGYEQIEADQIELMQVMSAVQYSVAFAIDAIFKKRFSDFSDETKNEFLPVKKPVGFDHDGMIQLEWLKDRNGRYLKLSRQVIHNSWSPLFKMLVDQSVHMAIITEDRHLALGVRGEGTDHSQGTKDNFAGHTGFKDGRPEIPEETAWREFAEELGFDDRRLLEARTNGDIRIERIGKENGFANRFEFEVGRDGGILMVGSSGDTGDHQSFHVAFESADLFAVYVRDGFLREMKQSIQSASSDMQGILEVQSYEDWLSQYSSSPKRFGASFNKLIGKTAALDNSIVSAFLSSVINRSDARTDLKSDAETTLRSENRIKFADRIDAAAAKKLWIDLSTLIDTPNAENAAKAAFNALLPISSAALGNRASVYAMAESIDRYTDKVALIVGDGIVDQGEDKENNFFSMDIIPVQTKSLDDKGKRLYELELNIGEGRLRDLNVPENVVYPEEKDRPWGAKLRYWLESKVIPFAREHGIARIHYANVKNGLTDESLKNMGFESLLGFAYTLNIASRPEMRDVVPQITTPLLAGDLLGTPVNLALPTDLGNYPADEMALRNSMTFHMPSKITKQPANDFAYRRLKIEMEAEPDNIEPQVAWASQILTIKGYIPGNSGFNVWYQTSERSDPFGQKIIQWHSIDLWIRLPTLEEIKLIESVPGALYDAKENGVFVNARGKTMAEVKAVFDQVALILPDHGDDLKNRIHQFETMLKTPNQSFVMRRELIDGKEFFHKRNFYLERYLSFLKHPLDEKATMVELGEKIGEADYQKQKTDANFISKIFADAIAHGHVLVLDGYDLNDTKRKIPEMIKAALDIQNQTIHLGGQTLHVHPDFRMVFMLDAKETQALNAIAGKQVPVIEFPQLDLRENSKRSEQRVAAVKDTKPMLSGLASALRLGFDSRSLERAEQAHASPRVKVAMNAGGIVFLKEDGSGISALNEMAKVLVGDKEAIGSAVQKAGWSGSKAKSIVEFRNQELTHSETESVLVALAQNPLAYYSILIPSDQSAPDTNLMDGRFIIRHYVPGDKNRLNAVNRIVSETRHHLGSAELTTTLTGEVSLVQKLLSESTIDVLQNVEFLGYESEVARTEHTLSRALTVIKFGEANAPALLYKTEKTANGRVMHSVDTHEFLRLAEILVSMIAEQITASAA